MLVACRLAGLSALEAYYAGVRARAQFGRHSAPGGLPPLRPAGRPRPVLPQPCGASQEGNAGPPGAAKG
jgi:hypothetical protein